MTHFLFARRQSLFAEARLLHMAPPPGETPQAPDAAPDAPKQAVDTASHADAHAEMGKRVTQIRERIDALQRQMDAVAKLKEASAKPGATVDATKAADLGVVDADGDTDVDHADIDAAHADLKTQIDAGRQEIADTKAEMGKSLDAIRQSGPAGKIDAAMLQMQQVIDGNASLGEMLQAVGDLIKAVRELFNGTDPSAAGGKGPESTGNSLQAKKKDVQSMLDEAKKNDPAINTLAKLKDQKQKELDDPATGKRKLMEDARGTLKTKEQELVGHRSDLAALEAQDPKDQGAIDAKKVLIAGVEGEVKVLQEALRNAEAEVKKIEADIKKIDDVQQGAKDGAEKYNVARLAMRAALKTVMDKIEDADVLEDLKRIEKVLDSNNATAGTDGGIELKIPAGSGTVDLLKAFTDQGVTNTTDFALDPSGKIGNPDAFLAAIQQLITKVEPKVDAKPDAKPAA